MKASTSHFTSSAQLCDIASYSIALPSPVYSQSKKSYKECFVARSSSSLGWYFSRYNHFLFSKTPSCSTPFYVFFFVPFSAPSTRFSNFHFVILKSSLLGPEKDSNDTLRLPFLFCAFFLALFCFVQLLKTFSICNYLFIFLYTWHFFLHFSAFYPLQSGHSTLCVWMCASFIRSQTPARHFSAPFHLPQPSIVFRFLLLLYSFLCLVPLKKWTHPFLPRAWGLVVFALASFIIKRAFIFRLFFL